MTNQELYTTVRRHLLTQMAKSLDTIGLRCRYRGEDGLKCAIGCLIPDTKYQPSFESNSANNIYVAEAAGLLHDRTPRGGPQIILATDLQGVHDFSPVDLWEEELNELAVEHDLKVED